MRSPAIKAVHIFLSSLYVFSLSYNIAYVGKERGNIFTFNGYAGKFKYLTFLNLCLQTLYFVISSVNDFLGSNTTDRKKKTSLQKFRDFFHSTIIFPTGAFVVLTFWAIYAVDRELVYPRALDKIIPVWCNHVNHTFVLPFLLIDKMLINHSYPSKVKGFSVIVGFASIYLAWILWIAYRADVWVYPILKVLDTSQKAIFIFFLFLLFVSLYIIGEALTTFLWGKPASVMSSKQVKKKNKKT